MEYHTKMKTSYAATSSKIEKKITKKNERNLNKKKNGKNNIFTEIFKLRNNKKKERNIYNSNDEIINNNLQGSINKSASDKYDKNNEENGSESNLKKIINQNYNEKEIKNTDINFNNKTIKASSCKIHFNGNYNEVQKLVNECSFKMSKSYTKNDKDTCKNLSDAFNLKGEVDSSKNKIRNISTSIKSENEYESVSYGKFFEINNEAKNELSEHVKILLSNKNDSEVDFSDKQDISETDKYDDYINDKKKKKKGKKSKKNKKLKIVTKEIIRDDKNEDYHSFNKLKTIYESAHASTKLFLTKMINSKVYIEKNIPLYNDIITEQSGSLFKKLNIFNDEEKVDSFDQEDGFMDSVCEYFTYLMSLTLIK